MYDYDTIANKFRSWGLNGVATIAKTYIDTYMHTYKHPAELSYVGGEWRALGQKSRTNFKVI